MLDAKLAAIAFGGTFTGASTQLYKTGNYRLGTPKGSHYNSSDLRRTAGLQHSGTLAFVVGTLPKSCGENSSRASRGDRPRAAVNHYL